MNKGEINIFLKYFEDKKQRTIVIVDYGNVEKWKHSLSWDVGIRELANLIKNFSGKEFLRRFYYGADYGKEEKSKILTYWSKKVLETAHFNRFDVQHKRVKYIHDQNNKHGFAKKCDLDVEMAVDLIKERDNYDTIIIFSGDGDLMYAIRYLVEKYKKRCYVFGARDHIGREVYDAKTDCCVTEVLYVEDFEYRLSSTRFK
ncbi:MAG: NYN domain-containing protein [Candidatus Magasanikbacteria bacterium]